MEASNVTSKESCVDSLACVDVHQLGSSKTEARECLLDLVDLSTADSLDLSFTDSVAVEDDLGWISSVRALESLACVGHSSTQIVGRLLANVVLHD